MLTLKTICPFNYRISGFSHQQMSFPKFDTNFGFLVSEGVIMRFNVKELNFGDVLGKR